MENKQTVTDLVAACNNSDMATWSDDKRKEFTVLFKRKARSASAILNETVHEFLNMARERQYVSHRQTSNFFSERRGHVADNTDHSWEEIRTIAKQRAEVLLADLPPVKKVVRVVDPDLAKKMDERDALAKKTKVLHDKYEELSAAVVLADLDQKMPIGEFRKLLKDRVTKRAHIRTELDLLAQEGQNLQVAIDRVLFAGIKGLSKAVLDVAQKLSDQALSYGDLTRRVTDKVMFGDSKAATEILSHFEKNEAQLNKVVATEFAEVLTKMGITKKQLTK